MKVKLTYEETQTFIVEKEVEMTAAEYAKFLKDKDAQRSIHMDLSMECGDEHWECTESRPLYIEKIS